MPSSELNELETNVLSACAQGNTTADLLAAFGLNVQSFRTVRHKILSVTGQGTLKDAARYAEEAGLIPAH